MSFLGQLARAYVINRMAGGGRRRRIGQRGWSGGRFPRGTRGRTGFFGPVPYYSRQTRGGSRVAVSGCCLPIPLALGGVLTIGARRRLTREDR